ncbi:choice-of-anchor U domain-containing protein [Methanothermococcus okinawensis]|uniref:Alpha-galactosidase NEW3 domain-containing protein n=1 Tax=Methanothermococcus okinawensis (strain DSM 14208 / JCM 11175 / IH1) TaxID=647113 RepID=F8AN43_METOI|nr:choice-of-anchor U domain-containing protein [Methanothermococcus okinawensis]AEH06957.1 hypothetical protein Metok_0987 [Methanothermococcus okinawensis IH1]
MKFQISALIVVCLLLISTFATGDNLSSLYNISDDNYSNFTNLCNNASISFNNNNSLENKNITELNNHNKNFTSNLVNLSKNITNIYNNINNSNFTKNYTIKLTSKNLNNNVTINRSSKINNSETNKTNKINKNNALKSTHYLNIKIDGYKVVVKTNGELCGVANNIPLKFIRINNSDEYILSPVILNNAIKIYSRFGNETLNKTIFLNYTQNKTVKNKTIIVKDIYFPSEKIIIKTNFKPNNAYIIAPNNEIIDLKIHKKGKNYILSTKINKNIILGNYTVIIDGIKKSFVVDYYKINANFNNSCIFGNISYYYIMPKTVKYNIMPINLSGNVSIKNGSFCIPINLTNNNYSVILTCGNAKTIVLINNKKEKNKSIILKNIYFLLENITTKTNFKPNKAFIITPNNKTITLNFSGDKDNYIAEFEAKNVGVYKVVVDNLTKDIYVDDYKINVSLNSSIIIGNISWHLIQPKYVNYTLLPKNIRGRAEIKNNSFKINLTNDIKVVKIRCGNAFVNLSVVNNKTKENNKKSNFETINISNGNRNYSINFTINRGKFEQLKFKDKKLYLNITNITNGSSVNITVKLPFKIPEGMYIYYWKNVSGTLKAVNYSISKDRTKITFTLKDGVLDEDGKKNGRIIDPMMFYIPRYNVKTAFKNNKTGILHVYDYSTENELYNITVKISKGRLNYLAFVDKNNIPIKPHANLPFNLIKFRISNISKGESVNINITYSKDILKIRDNSKIYYYKFNPNNLKQYSINATLINNNTISFTLTDGKLGDDDNKSNGIIADDGGVGWVGYYSEWDAVIGSLFNQQIHTYWLYVPKSVENFSFGVFDGDGFIVNIYSPNGTLYTTLNESANGNWNYTQIYTNGNYGLWKIVINNTKSNYPGGNYYNLNISGDDRLNLKVNMTYTIKNGETYYGTPNATLLNHSSDIVSSTHEFYVYATSDFNISIFDPDNYNYSGYGDRLNVSIYYPNGTLYYSFYPYDNNYTIIRWGWWSWLIEQDNPVWVTKHISINGYKGWWMIKLTQEKNYGDNETGENQIILATNISDGLWFKRPKSLAADSGTATICRDSQTNMVHRYYTIIPYGTSNYTIGICDGDGLGVNISYPNGTLYGSYTAPNNAQNGEPPNYFQIDTNNKYGWWIINISEDSWPSKNGNYYSLSAINSPVLKLNHTYTNHSGYYGTPDAMIVGDNTSTLGSKTWYISTPKGLSSFNLSIYDGDGAINVSIYFPNGTKYKEFTAIGDETWDNYTINISNPNQTYGIWEIVVREISDYDDYLTGGNMYKIATTTKTGILSGNPRYNLSIVDTSTKSSVNTSETFNITVYVKDTGTMDMSNISVNITLPNGWSGETNKVIPHILPNQTVVLNFTLTAPSSPGNYIITVNTTNDYVHWDFDDSKNINITVVNNLLIKKINISAGLSAIWENNSLNITITVKSYNNARDVYVYWVKPNNSNVTNISGDFNAYGNNTNNVYWFKFTRLNAGESKNINIILNISNNCELSNIYNIGIDPK